MANQTVTGKRFGDFLLEVEERRLTRNGMEVSLTVKAFDLLALLVDRAGRLVTKEEILDSIWPDVNVGESTLTATIFMLRKALSQTETEMYIENVPKKGYRFVATIEAVGASGDAPAQLPVHAMGVQRTRLYVLGFVALAIVIGIGVWRFRAGRNPVAEQLLRTAVFAARQGDDKLAFDKFDELLRIRPDFTAARVKAGWLAYDDNEDDRAARYLQPLGAISGRTITAQTEALRSLLEGDRDGAIKKLQVALDAEPNNTDVLYELAELETELGSYEDAARLFGTCIQIDKSDPFCAFGLLQTAVYRNQFNAALTSYQMAVGDTGGYPWLEYAAGYAALALNDLDRAASHFRKLEEFGRKHHSTMQFRDSQEGFAALYLFTGKVERARQQILAALDTSDSPYDKASYYVYLAQIDAVHGRQTDARKEIDDALRLSESNDFVLPAAKVLASIGEFDRASKVIEDHSSAGSALGPAYPAAKRFVSALQVAHDGNVEHAIELLSDAYRYDPSPDTAYALARMQMQAQRWSDASVALGHLSNENGKILFDSVASLVPLTQYNLAVCDRHRGNTTAAAESLSRLGTQWKDADPPLKALLQSP